LEGIDNLLIIGAGFGLAYGVLLQKGDFCFVSAFRDWFALKHNRVLQTEGGIFIMASMIKIYIPTPYRDLTGNQSRVEIAAGSVKEAMQVMLEQYPGLQDRVYHNGELAPHLNIYVSGTEIRNLDGETTGLQEGDEIALVPAMAGGTANDSEFPAKEENVPLLNEEQMDRYSRHNRLPEVGVTGQRKLLDAKVLIVGAGGLGSPAGLYLASAGVGTLGFVDGDRVERSNLQRQVLHDESGLGRLKVETAKERLEKINPDVHVNTHPDILSSNNAFSILEGYDLVINGCDNFPTRYLINDACVLMGKPLVDAAILRFEGQATVYYPGRGCYRCLFPTPPPPGSVPSCAEAGIIGALAGQMGSLQAMQAIKLILGVGETLANRLYMYDALVEEHHMFNWEKREDCPVCGDNPTIKELIDYEEFCGVPAPGTEAESNEDRYAYDLSPEKAKKLIDGGAQVIDVREPREFARQHVTGSTLVPLGELEDRLDEIDYTRPAVFVCQIGERSYRAVKILREAGFTETYNLAGGIIAWVNHRFPVKSEHGDVR